MPEPSDSERARRLRVRDRAHEADGTPSMEAAALSYEAGEDAAPKVVAHGRGHVAQRMLELAAEHDLPIRSDPTLVSILAALDVGAEVPPDLYGVIAEVLAWAYHADREAGNSGSRAA